MEHNPNQKSLKENKLYKNKLKQGGQISLNYFNNEEKKLKSIER